MMLFIEGQEIILRQWLHTRLEKLEDIVDPEVLTDFVCTLLKSSKPLNLLRDEILHDLSDILEDECELFVRDLFQEISSLSLTPSQTLQSQAALLSDPFTESEQPDHRRKNIVVPVQKFNNEYNAKKPPPFNTTNIRWRSRIPQTPKDSPGQVKSRPRSKSADRTPEKQNKTSQDTKSPQNQHRTMQFDLWPDPSDPSYPMRQASFALMQQNFPYLTQLWLNNVRMQEQANLERLKREAEEEAAVSEYWEPGTTGLKRMTTSPHLDRPQVKCHDFDVTGLCIRGNACPHKHVTTRTPRRRHLAKDFSVNPNSNPKSPNDATESTTTTFNPNPSSPSPAKPETETLYKRQIRTRQARFQAEHEARRADQQEQVEKRAELAEKSAALQRKLRIEKEKLARKLAGTVKVRGRGRAGTE